MGVGGGSEGRDWGRSGGAMLERELEPLRALDLSFKVDALLDDCVADDEFPLCPGGTDRGGAGS